MTLEELKLEAKKHGYYLAKRNEYVHHVRCRCGKRGSLYHTTQGYGIYCNNCGNATENWHKSEQDVWKEWKDINED